ncbi:MAG: hypothetical protein ACU85V_20535 [Gammaproteobacteria bacterium]
MRHRSVMMLLVLWCACTPAAGLDAWARALLDGARFEAGSVTAGGVTLSDVALDFDAAAGELRWHGQGRVAGAGALTVDGRHDAATGRFAVRLSGAALSVKMPRAGGPPVFEAVPIVPPWLAAKTARIDLELDELRVDDYALGTLSAHVESGDGALDISAGARFAGGSVAVALSAAPATGPAELRISGQGVALAGLPALAPYVKGSIADFELKLQGNGPNWRDFAATARGRVGGRASAGVLYNAALDRLAQNALSLTLTTLLPLGEPRSEVALECAALALDFDAGVARFDRGLVVLTKPVLLSAAGSVDLAAEVSRIDLLPRVRRGFAAITPGALSEIRLEGPLLEPAVKVRKMALLSDPFQPDRAAALLKLPGARAPGPDRTAPCELPD